MQDKGPPIVVLSIVAIAGMVVARQRGRIDLRRSIDPRHPALVDLSGIEEVF